MKNAQLQQCLAVLGCLISFSCLTGARAEAEYLITSGDSSIIEGLNASGNFPVDAGDRQFFTNILGTGKTVKILNTTVGSSFSSTTTLNLDAIANSYYNGLSGVTSSVVSGPITSALLSGTNLFIDVIPDAAFTASEITAVKAFLAGGGTFFLLGENAGYTPTQNGYINSDLTALGSGMKLTSVSLDSGLHTATVANGQVLSAPLTSGITSFDYSYTTGVTGGQKLFLASDDTTTFVAAETQPSAAVPEPSSVVMTIAGLLSCLSVPALRRRATSMRGTHSASR